MSILWGRRDGVDWFLWSFLILANLVVVVSDLIDEEGLTLALSSGHSILRAWTHRETCRWLHGRKD